MHVLLQGMTERNPVWMVPLALPLALHASQSMELSIALGVAVSLSLFLGGGAAILLEQKVAPDLMIVVLVMAVAAGLTVAELTLDALGVPLTLLSRLLLRATAVSGLVVHPGALGRRRGPVTTRLVRLAGLVCGFFAGLLLLTAGRYLLEVLRVPVASSVAAGFFLLAVGRMVINSFSRGQGS